MHALHCVVAWCILFPSIHFASSTVWMWKGLKSRPCLLLFTNPLEVCVLQNLRRDQSSCSSTCKMEVRLSVAYSYEGVGSTWEASSLYTTGFGRVIGATRQINIALSKGEPSFSPLTTSNHQIVPEVLALWAGDNHLLGQIQTVGGQFLLYCMPHRQVRDQILPRI